MKRPDVDIVLVTWNAGAYLARCVEALRRHTAHWPHRLIVVNNGSTDGTDRWLRRQSDLPLLFNRRNLGVTRATNQALRVTRAGWLVRIGDDTEVSAGWLDRLWQAALGDSNTGLVGCRGLSPEGRIEVTDGIPGPPGWMWSGAHERDRGQRSYSKKTELVAGCVLMRRHVLERVGLYDERLSDLGEDTDFGLRVRLAGFSTFYEGSVSMVHHRLGRRRKERSGRNLGFFLRKWAGYREFPLPDTDPADRLHLSMARRLARGQPLVALRQLGKAPGKLSATTRLFKGMGLVQAGRWAEAESTLRPLAAFSARAEYLRGTVAARLGKLEEAGQRFQNALEHSPRFAPAYPALFETLFRQGKLQAAQETLEIGLERCPDHVGLQWAMVQWHHRQGRPTQARRLFARRPILSSTSVVPRANPWLYPSF